MEELFKSWASAIALSIEAGAVLIIALGAVEALARTAWRLVSTAKGVTGRKEIWVRFAIWLLLGLEFELAADVVRSAISPTWTAIGMLGAERIGHGTSAAQDSKLLAHLVKHAIPLEVCPSSNVATRAVPSLEEHPIRAFRDAGVTVTVNSDDPSMFGTSLNQEYAVAADLLDLDEGGLRDLAAAAVRASFAPDDVRTRVLAEIDRS